MKRANGTGGVVKLSGTRRRPYMARITAGVTPDGKRITKIVGYYATRDDALTALLDYNKSPYDIDAKQVTMAQLYKRWIERAKEQKRLAHSTIKGLKSAYKYCTLVYNTPYPLIKAYMMQDCVDSCGRESGTQGRIKQLFHQLDKYAFELDVINKRYSDLIHISPPAPKPKSVFRNAEVLLLWDNIDMLWVDTILILLYSGWRISELLGIVKKDVIIDPSGKTVNYMVGGIKTKAGKNRMVPIHSAILPLIKKRLESCNMYLIENKGRPISYCTYLRFFLEIMDTLGMKHTIHETRHTFRTWLDRTSASISCINRIMGHSCKDVGLQTYTLKTVEELRDAVELIKSIHFTEILTVSNK